ncbi:MAG: DUF2279 domain-containing protein [Burkholderiaceae bacterium]|nr:DUF2279 domain-containing protein [Burkholderiaceae bacterium]
MSARWFGVLTLVALGAACPVMAQGESASRDEDPAVRDERRVRLRTAAIVVGSVAGMAAYGKAQWWQDGFTDRFSTVKEGWFGQATRHGGADKLGHGMFGYTAGRLLTRAFEAAGNDRPHAVKLGAVTAVGTLLAAEIADGYSMKWRFSREDAVMDLLGGALAYTMETLPALDALVDLRLQYSPSRGPDGRREFNPFGDYSGQRYLLVFKASGVAALAHHRLWRYLEVNLGYATRQFDPEWHALASPSRRVSVGISLNLGELLRRTVYDGDTRPTRTRRVTETVLEYVQLPGTEAHADRVLH